MPTGALNAGTDNARTWTKNLFYDGWVGVPNPRKASPTPATGLGSGLEYC